tara:strand:- start:2824 stop:3219 length:396 start_codon:yes stop_codon:yes gene_type:complete
MRVRTINTSNGRLFLWNKGTPLSFILRSGNIYKVNNQRNHDQQDPYIHDIVLVLEKKHRSIHMNLETIKKSTVFPKIPNHRLGFAIPGIILVNGSHRKIESVVNNRRQRFVKDRDRVSLVIAADTFFFAIF